MQNPLVRFTYCMPPSASRIKDIESKYYVALRLSVYRDLGATIAANPSTILAIARLGDREKATLDPRPRRRHDRPEVGHSRRGPRGAPAADPLEAEEAARAARSDRRADRPAPAQGLLAEPRASWPTGPAARWGPTSAAIPSIFGDRPVRDVGLIASEGRMTIPIEDGTPAGILDIRHHYFEFIPEDQADREEPETVEAADLIEGRRYFILPDDGRRALPLPDPRPGPLRRLPRQGPADRVPEQGGALLEPDRREALRVPGGRRRRRGPAHDSGSGSARSCSCRPGAIRRYYTLLVEEADLADGDRPPSGWRPRSRPSSSALNVEYENKRATLRLGPIRVRRIAAGSWADFQRRTAGAERGNRRTI